MLMNIGRGNQGALEQFSLLQVQPNHLTKCDFDVVSNLAQCWLNPQDQLVFLFFFFFFGAYVREGGFKRYGQQIFSIYLMPCFSEGHVHHYRRLL